MVSSTLALLSFFSDFPIVSRAAEKFPSKSINDGRHNHPKLNLCSEFLVEVNGNISHGYYRTSSLWGRCPKGNIVVFFGALVCA